MNRYEKYIAEHPEAAKPELEEEEESFFGINPSPVWRVSSVNAQSTGITLEMILEGAERIRRSSGT